MKNTNTLLTVHLAIAKACAYTPAIRINSLIRACVVVVAMLMSSLAFAAKTPTPVLYVASVTTDSVGLYWTDVAAGEIDWTLERATVSTGPFSVVARLAPNTTNYTDTTVLPGTTYYYRAGYMPSKGTRKTSGIVKVKTLAAADTTLPTVTVTAPTASALVAGPITLTATASDNIGVVRVDFYVDDAAVGQATTAPFSVSFDTRTVASGNHTVIAKAIDAAGNSGASAAVAFRTDNTAPSVPAAPTATAASSTQIGLSWSASTDDISGVAAYRVYRNGTLVATVASTSFTDTNLTPATQFCYTIAAVDQRGNVSANSASACATTLAPADTTPPTVPANVAATAPTCTQVNVSWSASTDGGSGVKSYLVFKNGALWREVSAPATSTSDTAVSASTSYSYAVAAKDVAGNQSVNSAAASVTVPACSDTTAPTVPTNFVAVAPTCAQVNLSWNAATDAGGSGLKGYDIYRNGAYLGQVLAPATNLTDSAVAASTSYSYRISSVDNADNISPISPAVSVTMPACPDAAAPSVPANVVASAGSCSQVNISWSASTDAGSGVKSYLVYKNGTFWREVTAPATSTSDTAVSASTSYSYAVAAKDVAGNQSANSAASSVTLPACPDTTAPTVPANVVATAPNCSQVNISWSASTDAGSGVKSYLVYKNGTFWREVTAPATSTSDTTVSASTSYSYAVAAKDVAGNQSANSAASSVTLPACPDTTAPTPPGNVAAAAVSCSRIDVSWAASTDAGSGVKGYRVYRNGALLQEVLAPATSWSDTTVAASTSYSYTVTAFDNVGNVSAASATASTTTPACGAPTGRFIAVTLLGGTDSDYGMALAVDANGNVISGGSVAGRPYFAKLSPSRQILWSFWLANAGSVQAVAMDPTGDVVVTGYFYGTVDFGGGPITSTGGYDVFVAKFSSGGALRWVNRYGSPQGADFAGDEAANGVAVDANGNIVVVGSYLDTVNFGNGPFTTRGGKDAFILKLNSSGVALWSKTFGNTGTDDAATAVKFDAGNNVYVGGRFSIDVNLGGTTLTAAGSYDLCVAKFTAAGAHVWSKRSGGGGYDTVRSLAVDNAGDVLVTGDYRLSANFDGVAVTTMGEEDVFLLKYSGASGAQQWAKSFGSWNTDSGNAVSTDGDRNIVIAGRLGAAMDFGGGNVTTPRAGYNIYVAKFTPTGTHLWSKAFGNGREEARGVAIDSRNYPFVAGRCGLTNNFGNGVFSNYGSNMNPDMIVMEFEP